MSRLDRIELKAIACAVNNCPWHNQAAAATRRLADIRELTLAEGDAGELLRRIYELADE